MKTTFTLDQVKQLLVLNPEQQQQIIGFSDSLTETTDEEIVSMAVADDAPEMIRDLHRRARAAISRRKRRLQPEHEAENARLSNSSRNRLLWFSETILPQIGRLIRDAVSQARNAFSTLSPGQIAAVSRQAYNTAIQFIRPHFDPLLADSAMISRTCY
ncbi:MAG: hypothetical protein U0M50_07840 [Paramuribaculum sp.]